MKNATYAVLVMLSFMTAGAMNYCDEQQEEKQYCEMVKQHIWPDFKRIKCV